jgi:hypothetical protein
MHTVNRTSREPPFLPVPVPFVAGLTILNAVDFKHCLSGRLYANQMYCLYNFFGSHLWKLRKSFPLASDEYMR